VTNFASLPEDKRREYGSRGGKKAQATNRAHRWTVQEASEAGKRSGKVRKARKKGKQK
jgi:hypothetical protein